MNLNDKLKFEKYGMTHNQLQELRSFLVERIVDKYKSKVSSDVSFNYVMDTRSYISDNVDSLQGNIILATVVVLLVTMIALGIRSSLIVGSGIPVSILITIFVMYALGYNYNFMVMFGILVALGMLIDGSLVVVELADRKMLEGLVSRRHMSIRQKECSGL